MKEPSLKKKFLHFLLKLLMWNFIYSMQNLSKFFGGYYV